MRLKTLLFLLVLNLYALGQAYQPILQGNKEWLVCSSEFGTKIYNYYYAKGDTIINGKYYTKLNGYHYNGNFLLREDRQNRRVYLLIINVSGLPEEFLLYDFNLSIGETIFIENPISPAINDAGYYELDSITTELFQQQFRRVFHLHTNDNSNRYPYTKWIEGIGSTALINTPGVLGDTSKLAELFCTSENNQTVYTSFISDTCYSNKRLDFPKLAIENKFDLWLDFNNTLNYQNLKEPLEISLLNTAGKQVFKSKLINNHGKLELPNLPKGVYFVVLINPEKTDNSSVVKVLLN